MHPDIIELRSFYGTTLGHLTERAIRMSLAALWEPVANERLVGLGYSLPYLDRFSADTERSFAFMPAGQGAIAWPSAEKSATALVFDEDLPLPDSSIDRILMVHALEYAENAAESLKEMWRVLAPNGRLVIVVPNRRGVWARLDHTPFGSGRPYSRTQLTALLREANFTVNNLSNSLHFPPVTRRWMMRPCMAMEGMGRKLWPLFAGVLVVEAQKRLYQGLPVARRSSRRVFVPALAPHGTPVSGLRKGLHNRRK
ncbi:SAM-dependent methyltransferase [Falsochrobactrum shanghaiense]|uniref:SAM-dependent methyltransferase n=1 Tax=Falsochrobactrum shanghaiense TaxID=2201899 RepID=A0A316JCF0_9HYPH|nr:class I SAM-dependent methyltransferase [Falsochrobactrum shanghaiense]PWL19667.1 SAM-dependent methyltransferase [Falsochrobactrum shanghaiense]